MKLKIIGTPSEGKWYYDCVGMEFEAWLTYEKDDKPRYWIKPESIPKEILETRFTTIGHYAVQYKDCEIFYKGVTMRWTPFGHRPYPFEIDYDAEYEKLHQK